MKRACLFVVIALVLGFGGRSQAEDFDVTNATQLRDALTASAGNGENDTINIEGGQYDTSGSTFSYIPSLGPPEENHSLTIVGAGAGNTVLDGGGLDQVMNIDTTGITDDDAHILIRGMTFRNGGGVNSGAGLLVWTTSANIAVEDSAFSNNSAGVAGGANFSSESGTVTLVNNSFSNNSALWVGGGAIASSTNGTVTLRDNTFRDNFAGGGAGTNNAGGLQVSTDTGTIMLTSNAFRNNSTVEDGGGVSLNSFYDSTATLQNNIFSGNSARFGGGAHVSCEIGTVNLTNNTFSGNSAYGGGLFVELWENIAIANIYNNIIWGNTGTFSDLYVQDDMDVDLTGARVNLYHNDYTNFDIEVGDNLFRGDNIDQDPLFVDVSDPDPGNWDLHLNGGSPCIDAGTANAPSLPATDFDGEPRIRGPAPDMGADETPPAGGGGFIFLLRNDGG